MTDRQEQMQQHAEAELQVKQQEQAKAAQEERPARSQEELLRDAMGASFVSHCVNGRLVECQEHQADPRIVGGVDAVATVIEQVINLAGKEGIEQQFGAVIEGLGLLTVNGAPALQLIVQAVVAKAAEQGHAFSMLGELQGMAVKVMVSGAMNQVYSACTEKMAEASAGGALDPMKPFSPVDGAAPAGDGQGEDLPEQFQQDVEVARQQVERGEAQPYQRRTAPAATQAKPKARRPRNHRRK